MLLHAYYLEFFHPITKEISYRKFGSQETTTVSDLEFVKLVDECIENKKANI